MRSGYKVVDQTADRPALPNDYKAQVVKARPDIEPSSATSSPNSPYVPVGNCTLYTGGEEMMTKLRFYFTDSICSAVSGMKIGYPNNSWTKVMGRKTGNVRDWTRLAGETITIVTSTFIHQLF